jgi:hypothetical protein
VIGTPSPLHRNGFDAEFLALIHDSISVCLRTFRSLPLHSRSI